MKIVKRNGEQVSFSPNKILTRIKKTAKGLKVNSDKLAIEVQTYLYDGITTQAIDDQTAKLAAQYAINHPDYSMLSSRIISSKLHKDFGTGVESWKARLTHLLKPEIFEKQAKWGVEPNYEYDETFDFLGISSFITVYGVKDESYDRILGQKTETLQELPAEMMFRVALFLSESKEEFEYRYARLTNRNYGGATPVLMNAGTPNSSMISCSVNELMGDSLEGIHETLHSISKMSKDGAGIGLWAGRLRSSKTRYSNKGKAGGIGRFAKVLDAHLRFFKQNECYSDDTEILTNKGYVLFKELTNEHLVAEIDENEQIRFVKPEAIQEYDYDGTMFSIKSGISMDLLVTENHDIVYKTYNKKYKRWSSLKKKPISLTNYHRDNGSSNYGFLNNDSNRRLSDLERFMIAYQADGGGFYTKKLNNDDDLASSVSFRFSKKRKIERFVNLLERLNFEYSINETTNNIYNIYVHNVSKDILIKTFNISYDEMSLEFINEFLDEVSYWDATKLNSNSFTYYSTNKENIDFVQTLATLSGRRTNIFISNGNTLGVTITRGRIIGGQSTNVTKQHYKGKVYCCTVPSGMIVVRRNNRVTISGNSRRGKGALYLNIWHRDLHSFIELASKEGSEETTARDLMTAVIINDLFYKRLIGDDVVVKVDAEGNQTVVEKQWSLFCPHDIKEIMGYNLYDFWGAEFEEKYKECENNPELPRTTVNCDDVVLWITNMQSKSGHPYILNIDNVNRVNNQKNYGIIKMSQLCVGYDTNILTDRGNIVIGEHVGEKHNIWNGKEFSEVEILKTGENQKLLTVTLTDGTVINATEYHRWFINENGKEIEKQTKDLVEGDKIIKFDLPILRGHKELESAYTKGLFSADGHLADNGYSKLPMINLYGDKKQLVDFLDIRNVETGTGRTSIETPNSKAIYEYTDKTVVGLNRKIQDKNFVPLGDYTLESKLQWLSGLADGGGGTIVNNEGFKTIQISSTNKEFLTKVKLMLTEIGVQSKIRLSIESGVRSLPNHKDGYSNYECGAVYRLLISSHYLNHLIMLGLETNRLDLTNKKTDRNCFRYNTIESVTDNGLIEDTYCVQEPKEQRAVFNGILTGNCIEIVQYTDVDISAQCCLGAMLLASYVKNGKFDFEALREYTADLNYMLNRVIDRNDWSNKYSKKGGLSQRATAIGVAGFADVLYMLDISFESDEAKELNKRIFETIYYGSIEGSVKYRKENPHIFDSEVANMLDGTEVGQGRFVWEKYDDAVPTMDWDSLRSEVLKHGVANSMFCATMPTASSSTLAMQNEMYEPMQDIAVVRKTISGEFPFINKYLIEDLEKKGILFDDLVTDIKRANSVQNISFEAYTDDIEWINHIRSKYKTIWEMPQKVMVELAADRQRFIDQAQSMNLYWADPSVKKLTSALVKGWKSGLKTGVYYTKTKPKTQADKSLGLGVKEIQPTVNINNPSSDFFCDGCSA